MTLLNGCAGFLNRALLFPTHEPVDTLGRRETLPGSGALEGRELELFYAEFGRGQEPDLYVLSFTGNAGRAEFMPEYSARLLSPWMEESGGRVAILALQYPGYGSDREPATLAANAQAAHDALRHLRGRAGDKPIVIHGLSLGTTVALHVARTHPSDVQGLVLEKPPNLRSMILGRYGWWNLWLFAGPIALSLPASAISDRNAAAIDGIPAVFLVAERDEIVPPSYSRQIFEVYGGPRRWVDAGTYHNGEVTPRNAPELHSALEWLGVQAGR